LTHKKHEAELKQVVTPHTHRKHPGYRLFGNSWICTTHYTSPTSLFQFNDRDL